MRLQTLAQRCAAVIVTALVAATLTTAPASAAEVYEVPTSGSWKVDGRGYGHGYGMSQWGAQGAALKGLTYQQILDFYYPGTQLVTASTTELRVRLERYRGATVTLSPPLGTALRLTDLASNRVVTLGTNVRVVLRLDGTQYRATQWAAGTPSEVQWASGVTTAAGPVQVTATSGGQVDVLGDGNYGRRYPGAVRVVRDGSVLQAVNHVGLDEYVRGVVPRESPSSWAPAALQAQAVAARTYALSVLNRQASWDICDSTQCQVYGGFGEARPDFTASALTTASTDAAVAATARKVLNYGSSVAFTQYSSSNGGWTRAGSRPYQQARQDPYTGTAPGDTVTSWSAELSVSRVQQSCPSGGRLQRMVVQGRDGNGAFGGRITSVRLECTTGNAVVSSPAFGLRSSWWTVSRVSDPVGQLDGVSATGDKVRVHGWAFDPDAPTQSLYIWVTVNGVGQHVLANTSRPDVGRAYAGVGNNHGFDTTLTLAPGTYEICATASNVGAGNHTALRCASVTTTAPAGSNPKGQFDEASVNADKVRLRGWAFDPDAPTQPLYVWVTVDGVGQHVLANTSRPDVGRAYPGVGDNHGFDATLTLAPGTHTVCATATNVGPGSHTALGVCRSVTTRSAVTGSNPKGNFEGVTANADKVTLRGWAFDPDAPTQPLYVWVTVDGVGQHVLANTSRPDVGRAYPGVGDNHGFDATLTLAPGTHTVCATATNVGPGNHTSLGGCRQVTTRAASTASNPQGQLESVTAGPGTIRLSGWAFDPDAPTQPLYVWVTVDGVGQHVLANTSRPDVGRAYPGVGDNHGLDATLTVAPGAHTICVTASNVGAGSHTELRCGWPVTVPA